MTMNETRAMALELKFADDAGTPGVFEGLAAAYGNLDEGGDIIAPGAFAASLMKHKRAGTKPALLWSHDQSQPIGVIDDLRETPEGLRIAGRLALDTVKGAEAHALAKMGAMTGLSIGYQTNLASRDANGVRTIKRAHVGEVSIVALPMNNRARIVNVKGSAEMENETAIIADETVADETKARLDELESKLAAATKRADDMELKMQRPLGFAMKDERAARETKAFATFLRHGREALNFEEVKSLQISPDTQGGYLAPPDFSAEVDKNIVQFSPVRQAARVGQTASGSVLIPKRTGAPTAAWVNETETRAAAEATYGQAEIPISEAACYVDVSNRLLEDAAVNVEAEVAFDLAEEFGRIEGAAFVSGDGVKKPLGFMADAGVSFTNGGHASQVTSDGLIDLFYALAPFYRQRGVWMMNGATLAAIRKLKDTTGQYLWQPSIAAGQPETILGRPAIEAVDMPDVAANAFPVVFGDFSTGYRIYDRVALALMRDPYTVATSGLVRFHARRRVGGAVVRAEALRKLKIAA